MADNLKQVWPTDIKLADQRRALKILWDDGREDRLDAEYLRVESPSAEVQGHSPLEKKTVPGKKDILIQDVTAVGTYAVKIVFSDGHSTGIYSWSYLRKLADTRDELWGRYLEALAAQGLSR